MRIKTVRVCDIILEASAKGYLGPDDIGTIFYQPVEDDTPIYNGCSAQDTAKPIWKASRYPVPSEIVYIIKGKRGLALKGINPDASIASIFS